MFIRRAGESASVLLKRDFGTDDAPVTPRPRCRHGTEGEDMPTGLTAPLTGANFSTMTIDELCNRHRELLKRIREVDHWQRLIAARLDLAVAAVADIPEPYPEPAPLIPALSAELGGPDPVRRAIASGAGGGVPAGDGVTDTFSTDLAALLGQLEGTVLPGGFEGFDADQDGAGSELSGLAQIPVVFPPEGLRDLLGIARYEDRLGETALLPLLREAAGQLGAYGDALRNLTDEAAQVIAIRLGTPELPG
jgi:hypothetical protein